MFVALREVTLEISICSSFLHESWIVLCRGERELWSAESCRQENRNGGERLIGSGGGEEMPPPPEQKISDNFQSIVIVQSSR